MVSTIMLNGINIFTLFYNATPDMSAQDLCDLMIEQFSSMSFDGLTGEGMTWANGLVSKSPKGMVIENGAYVGM